MTVTPKNCKFKAHLGYIMSSRRHPRLHSETLSKNKQTNKRNYYKKWIHACITISKKKEVINLKESREELRGFGGRKGKEKCCN